MKSLISRESYRPKKRYSGVYHIQGGMVTDADLDERSRITQDRTDNLGDDAIKDGVPATNGAVAIAADNSLSLREGVIYADGVRGVLTAEEGASLTGPLDLLSAQADFPFSPALRARAAHIIYADIWERPVHSLEDSYLADAGLHGAVTTFRTRTMTQIKAAPLAARDNIEKGTGPFPKIGSAKLSVKELNLTILADDCDPCADVVSAEKKVANALWRLEVIDITGKPEVPGSITLAWSIENAAAIAKPGVSAEHFERTGKVYEYYSEITESHLGVFAKASDAKRSAFVENFGTTPTPSTNHDSKPWPFVRRWDGQAVIDTAAASITSKMGAGFQISISGQTIKLRVDAFDAELDLSAAAVVPGDYWLVELRSAEPTQAQVQRVQEMPFGVIHHYCVLFRVQGDGKIAIPKDDEIRKLSFPVLSDLPASHVGFENNCPMLYEDAENVQEALDNLCAISADDIAFDPNCPDLYDNATNVQEAFDALCNIDFSVHESFRLLFDWGVVCGIIPALAKINTGQVNISAGSYLDRSGRITKYRGGTIDLNSLRFGREIAFRNERELHEAFRNDQVCLALAAEEGGKTSIHVVPKSIAFGPDDPGFAESAKLCLGKKQRIELDRKIARLPVRERKVANKVILSASGDGVFGGSAKLTDAEARNAAAFNEKLFQHFKRVSTKEEIALLKARTDQAIKDNPIDNVVADALQVRQMQRATAVFTAFAKSDEERLRRCICEALFPKCPPELGKRPFYVPIACLRGNVDSKGFFLTEVCAFCCRKQAMTWRSLQYFIGDTRDDVQRRLASICCPEKEEKDDGGVGLPGLTYDPGKYADPSIVKLAAEYKLGNVVLRNTPKPVTDYETKVAINDLSEADAKGTLAGNGIDVTEIINIDDEKAFEIIEDKSRGVSAIDRLISGGLVRPGDKVGLLVQEGTARGYVLLERGSGKHLFSSKAADPKVGISREDELRANELITATRDARGELSELATIREGLTASVTQLRSDVDALSAERDRTIVVVKDAQSQLAELAETQAEITRQIDEANKELSAADKNRKAMVTTIRRGQPVTTIIGNNKPELVSGLAGAGITSVADISKLTEARIKTLVRSGILKTAEVRQLKRDANTFLNKPLE